MLKNMKWIGTISVFLFVLGQALIGAAIENESTPTVDSPKWTGNFSDDTDQMIVARALFGEARGESREGKEAVAWVIRNRRDNPRWWNNNTPTYHATIIHPGQFAAFNLYGQNRKYVEDPSLLFNIPAEKDAWYESYDVAGKVIRGELPDHTLRSDHFEAYTSRGETPPYWADPDKRTVKIGNHTFYRLELSPPDMPSPTPTPAITVTPAPTPTPEPAPEATPAPKKTPRGKGKKSERLIAQ